MRSLSSPESGVVALAVVDIGADFIGAEVVERAFREHMAALDRITWSPEVMGACKLIRR